MLGLEYIEGNRVRSETEKVKAYLKEEGGSPFIVRGVAAELVARNVDTRAVCLDFGVGSGILGSQLREKGFVHIEGADIDDYRDAENKDAYTTFQKVDASMEKFPWPDNYFDAVMSFETFEHLENPYHAAREVQRILKPGGLFIVSIPNVQHIFNKIFFLRKGDMPRWRKNNNHLGIFPRGVFAKLFLRLFTVQSSGFFLGFFPWRFLSRMTWWPENEWFGHTAWYVLKKSA